MIHTRFTRIVLAFLAGFSLHASARAGDFHFPVGLTYASGIQKAIDRLDDLYTEAGFDFDQRVVVPIGLSLNPYYEFDYGVGIGLNVGPISTIVIERRETGFRRRDDWDVSYMVPVGAHLRYTVLPDQDVSPYVKVGFKYPIVGGPNLAKSKLGVFGAVGVELWRHKPVGLAIEAGYDDSRIDVEGPGGRTKRVTFPGFTISVSAVF